MNRVVEVVRAGSVLKSDNLRETSVSVPELVENEILVRVNACGVCD